ncbi:ABC transporter permease [Timonella sp. A28]|uniref:ABC transporter permease n=1 Tax=Timonella sp. A28 TaxID=3442640 RepID=UPI003EB89D9B
MTMLNASPSFSITVPTPIQETLIVIRREILTRTTNKTILLATAALALLLGTGAAAGGWFLVDAVGDGLSINLGGKLYFATAMVTALLISLVYSAASLTSGVVEEKASRVVEILITKIGVVPLLAGKLIGIGLVTLSQLILIGGAGVLGFSLVDGWSVIEADIGSSLLWFFVWFLLGYIIFAILNTTLASTVSKQEDLSSAVMPMSFMQMVMLVVSLYVLPKNPDSTILEVLSFFPLSSSYLMPIRYGLGLVETWELVVAAAIAAVAIPALFAVATRVYKNNALRTGSKVSLQQSFVASTSN